MAKLAIKGHATRGNEVIKILEMLGGINEDEYVGDQEFAYYFINDNYIDWCHECTPESNFISFTLEEFLEKFPYKVGDRVNYVKYNDEYPEAYTIQKMEWVGTTIEYLLDSSGFSALTKDLQPYEEETIENKSDLLQQLKDYFDNTPREVVEKEWHEYNKYNEIGPTVDEYLEYVNKIRQPKYPKTYEECCEVLDIESEWHLTFELNNSASCGLCINKEFEYICKLEAFRKLLICRDAYWKIAGEQMRLSEPWKPDWSTEDEIKYVIEVYRNNVRKNSQGYSNTILSFPTAEMRDAFKVNFDDDIEFCKEFL